MKKITVTMSIVVQDEDLEQALEGIDSCDFCLGDEFGHLGIPCVQSHLNTFSADVDVEDVTDEEAQLDDERNDFNDSLHPR